MDCISPKSTDCFRVVVDCTEAVPLSLLDSKSITTSECDFDNFATCVECVCVCVCVRVTVTRNLDLIAAFVRRVFEFPTVIREPLNNKLRRNLVLLSIVPVLLCVLSGSGTSVVWSLLYCRESNFFLGVALL